MIFFQIHGWIIAEAHQFVKLKILFFELKAQQVNKLFNV